MSTAGDAPEAPAPAGDAAPRRTALAIAVTLAVVAALLVLVLATREPATDRHASSPLIGSVSPLIAGETLDGDAFDLDRRRGEWVVVNFVAAWCVPCRREQPGFVRFSDEHAAAGDASIVSVIYDDSPVNVQEFFDELGGDWPVVLDPDGAIGLEFGVTAPPESFIITPSGVVVERFIGGVTADGLDAVITRFEREAG